MFPDQLRGVPELALGPGQVATIDGRNRVAKERVNDHDLALESSGVIFRARQFPDFVNVHSRQPLAANVSGSAVCSRPAYDASCEPASANGNSSHSDADEGGP